MAEETDEMKDVSSQIAKLLTRYAELKEGHDGVFIIEWIAVYEYSTRELELADQAGRGVCVPDNQSISASLGLARFAQLPFERFPR